MAITWGNTKITGSAEKEREAKGGATPTVTEFTEREAVHVQSKTVTVLKSSVENANETVTFDALMAAVDTALNGIATNDFIATNTVAAFGEVSSVSAEIDPKYGNVADNYVCACKIFTKIS